MIEIQYLDQEGLSFIEHEEGCVLHPYKDSIGIPTIGYGMTYYPDSGKKVTMQDKSLSQEQANNYFSQIVKPFELAVYSTTRDDINQHQFNALVSLCYNIGVGAFKGSTVHRLTNLNPNDPEIRNAFLMWSKAGGKPILLDRRRREADLYFKK